MPAQRAQLLQRLGAMHDVGKLRMPLEILHKPGRLTAEERAVARRWGAWRAELVAHAPGLTDAAFLLDRACRLDDATPLEAQVLAACDAFDSMTHRCPFRPAIQRQAVLAALSADRRLDPRIVAAIEAHAPEETPGAVDRRRSWSAEDPFIGPIPQRRREDRLRKD
jgi:HD-GYP domain-containing protein (c-di-GMP phosphodiesterase class II)